MIGEPNALGLGVGPGALRLLFERPHDREVRLVGLATAFANKRAMTEYAKVGLQPFRDFVELGEQYRYFTKSLTDAA